MKTALIYIRGNNEREQVEKCEKYAKDRWEAIKKFGL